MASPEGHDDDPDQGEVKIIVKEMWCSPYAADPHYTTDISKPVIDEIKQRKKLQSSASGEKDGNRLVIMDPSTHENGKVAEGLEWRLLAPTPEEAEIPESDDPDNLNSSNPSSLVIR